MEIDKIPRQTWIDLISGKIVCELEYLALKILLARIQLIAKKNTSPESFRKYTDELIDLFKKSQNIPSCKRDLEKIINLGAA